MTRTPVESSQLKSVGYDPETQTMEIEFHMNLIYQYRNVPPAIHAEMMQAESIGRYFARNIKHAFTGTKVP